VRLLFIGDAAATGFGTVTADLGRGLLDLGEDVRFLSQNAVGFTIPEPLGSRTYRLRDDARPEHVLAALTGRGMPDGWAPEAIIVLGDYFAARWIVSDPRIAQALRAVPSYHYVPVEGVDLPPDWRHLWDIVKPVAMTNFGADEIEKVVGYRPPMVYHGVDQTVFYPIGPNRPAQHRNDDGSRSTNKRSAKLQFGMDPDRVVLLRTDRHMPRKQYNRMLRALVPVFERNPEADLVIHCRIQDQGGFLMDTIGKFPVWFRKRIMLTLAHDTYQGLSREELNLLYNAADIYVQNSAEGFGLTVAEAIACGVPAVGIDYSAVSEVIGGPVSRPMVGPNGLNLDPTPVRDARCGLLARWHHLVDNEYDHAWSSVDEDAFGQAIERLIRKPSLRRALGAEGPKHVAANFSWSRAAEQFRDLVHARIEVAA
jgi:glycosyltransferase involved in cell wall biosynthesis